MNNVPKKDIIEEFKKLEPKLIASLHDAGCITFKETLSSLHLKDLYITKDTLNSITSYWNLIYLSWIYYLGDTLDANIEDLIAFLKQNVTSFDGSGVSLIECFRHWFRSMNSDTFNLTLKECYNKGISWRKCFYRHLYLENCIIDEDVTIELLFSGVLTIHVYNSDVKTLNCDLPYEVTNMAGGIQSIEVTNSTTVFDFDTPIMRLEPCDGFKIENSNVYLQVNFPKVVHERHMYSYYELVRFISTFVGNASSDAGRATPFKTISSSIKELSPSILPTDIQNQGGLRDQPYYMRNYLDVTRALLDDIKDSKADCIGRIELSINESVLKEKPELWQLLHTCIAKYLVVSIEPLNQEGRLFANKDISMYWSGSVIPSARGVVSVALSLYPVALGFSKVMFLTDTGSASIESKCKFFADSDKICECNLNYLARNGYLTKPLEIDELRSSLNKLIGEGNYMINITSTIDIMKDRLGIADTDILDKFNSYMLSLLRADTVSFFI